MLPHHRWIKKAVAKEVDCGRMFNITKGETIDSFIFQNEKEPWKTPLDQLWTLNQSKHNNGDSWPMAIFVRSLWVSKRECFVVFWFIFVFPSPARNALFCGKGAGALLTLPPLSVCGTNKPLRSRRGIIVGPSTLTIEKQQTRSVLKNVHQQEVYIDRTKLLQ